MNRDEHNLFISDWSVVAEVCRAFNYRPAGRMILLTLIELAENDGRDEVCCKKSDIARVSGAGLSTVEKYFAKFIADGVIQVEDGRAILLFMENWVLLEI